MKKIINTHLSRRDLNRPDYYWLKIGTAASGTFEWTAENINPTIKLVMQQFGLDLFFVEVTGLYACLQEGMNTPGSNTRLCCNLSYMKMKRRKFIVAILDFL